MSSRRIDPRDLPAESPLARVLRPHGQLVAIEHDGRPLDAFTGEPLAISLLANGVDTLARSVKFHRPRGPACLRANCDGCLTRINGVPNQMACRTPARAGARIESQNAFPTASLDILRVTDWFFPKRFDHHHLMVQFGTAINRAMQVFARRMAGLGTLPESEGAIAEAESIETDVLIAGAGAAGLAAAITIARAGFRVLLCEEEREAGGTLMDDVGFVDSAASVTGPALAAALERDARAAGVELRTDACVSATFDNATAVITSDRALHVVARVRLFANGAHELVGAFESNDLPGVYTARAGVRALRHGVRIAERVVIVGNAWPAASLARALRDAGADVEWCKDATLEGVDGIGSVSHANVREGSAARRIKCDAVFIAHESTPAYELLGQAGVDIEPDAVRQCFVPRTAPDGETERADVFACGAVRGSMAAFGGVDLANPLNAGGAIADGVKVGERIVTALREAPRREVRS